MNWKKQGKPPSLFSIRRYTPHHPVTKRSFDGTQSLKKNKCLQKKKEDWTCTSLALAFLFLFFFGCPGFFLVTSNSVFNAKNCTLTSHMTNDTTPETSHPGVSVSGISFFSFTHKTHERTDTQTKTISFLAPPNVPANDWPSTHTQHPFQAFLGLLLFLTICLSRSCATTVWPPNGSWTAPRCPRPSSGLPRTPRWLHGRTNPASCQ